MDYLVHCLLVECALRHRGAMSAEGMCPGAQKSNAAGGVCPKAQRGSAADGVCCWWNVH